MRDLMIQTLRACRDLKALALENIEALVDRMIADDHYISEQQGFAFYIKCDDETLDSVIENKELLTNPLLAQALIKGVGDNVHFIGIYSTDASSNGFQSIIKGMGKVIEKEHPKTVSWYNRTMEKFIIRRVSSCHQ